MEQRSARLRWLVVWVVAVVWMAAVLARLSYLQLFCYSDYLAKAEKQQERSFEISPMRGTIYDRKGRELAVSMPMDSCFADPSDIADPGMVARLLARPLDVSAEEIETKIREAHTPVRLAKKIPPETVERIGAMNLRGVFFAKENRRLYPQRDLAAALVGYVNTDEKGQGGIELSLDKWIRGRPGRVLLMANGRKQFYDRHESAPDPGASVVLTLDETIQYIAEKELARAIQDTHAKSGSVVVQDPNTGDLLAVANWPTFDPNDPGKYPDAVRMDRAVAAAYEPGSTFKIITMTGAIEHGVANPDELIDCQEGSIVVAGRVIHDHEPFGLLTVRDVLAHSSDVGAIKIALRLGAPRFYDVIRSFGLGQLTGIALPAENRGIFRPLDEWTPSSIGSIAIGQEVSATPIQIVSAVSAIANGGTFYPPRVVQEIRNADGSVQPLEHTGEVAHTVTDPRTAATVRGMMESVILEGTGRRFAQLDGYTAAGKSGTAQLIDPATGRYAPGQFNASFVGFAPVNNPVITILVVLDTPIGIHEGGPTAGPVFKRIAEQVLPYLDVPNDIPAPEDTETARSANPAPAPAAPADNTEARFQATVAKNARGMRTSTQTVAFGDQPSVTVPDLSGQSVRAVMESCERLGVVPALIGDGVAVEQSPEAGAQALRGSRITVRFGRPDAATLHVHDGTAN